uniref:Uncharacterized protein n=1 Tax=Chromera velia CCMP2878 TaxID=1169474 RepID=A0A0G4ICY5_9ALVE|eukprot:Cvel_2276.t1-p1 / transcript=Cvel_2276.t1 / gene=Cvel_2276 / organism=Chromera_velia_CCMP2878 / gene_product=hypothetical protein / transcript_product=hypothetical protein / location=Cvel_scaffold88:47728-49509(-) / protein_length=402 / sequence_SO=supercontig / SO=protein_coding / is_pseudo=false
MSTSPKKKSRLVESGQQSPSLSVGAGGEAAGRAASPQADSAVTAEIHSLLTDVYGPWPSSTFPQPLSKAEAGPSAEGDQRRYLWTDAFGVMGFLALASQDPDNAEVHVGAARSLIEATERTLGRPRDASLPMERETENDRKLTSFDAQRSTGFVGLRIGKVRALSEGTDAGMTFDGMYWHYVDKWLFALLRFAQASGDDEMLLHAAAVASKVFRRFFREGRGVYWKLSTDGKPVEGMTDDDSLSALVVFSCIQCALETKGKTGIISLNKEIDALRTALGGYHSPGTSDPLGWGFKWWKAQWTCDEACIRQLLQRGDAALSERHAGLPFRLYGALIGCRLSGTRGADLQRRASSLLSKDGLLSQVDRSEDPESGLWGINKVMRAVALDPSAMRRREDEPDVVV